jgi:ATPase subunit of ABC transporter with duplicated ATPase domains
MFGNNSKKLLAAIKSLQFTANEVLDNQEKIMSALDDLKAAVAKLSTDTSAEIAAAVAAIQASQTANAGAVAPADAEAIVAQLQALDSTITAETAALTPPAPTPAA